MINGADIKFIPELRVQDFVGTDLFRISEKRSLYSVRPIRPSTLNRPENEYQQLAVLIDWEGNRRFVVATAMRRTLWSWYALHPPTGSIIQTR